MPPIATSIGPGTIAETPAAEGVAYGVKIPEFGLKYARITVDKFAAPTASIIDGQVI